MNKFPIIRSHDWCSCDTWNGEKLLKVGTFEGILHFPDGTKQQVTITNKAFNETISDHGIPSSYIQHQLFAIINIYGIDLEIKLADTGILVEFLYPGI